MAGDGARRKPRAEATERRDAPRDRTRCPECDDRVVRVERTAEIVCEGCGLVIETAEPDSGPEWRAFDQEERDAKSRVGAPTTPSLHDRGLSTRIGWKDADGFGRAIEPRKRRRLSRLRTWDERFRSRDSRDRNLKFALGEIDRMSSALGVPQPTRETASVLYRRALDQDLLPGRSIEGVATAAVYAATRLDGIPRSIDEVAAVSRVDDLEIERTYRYVVRELAVEVPPTRPTEYLGRFASALDCSDETERRARELLETAIEAGVHSGKHPVGMAASALYAAARSTDDELTQSKISDAATVSEVTIGYRYREVLAAAEQRDRP